MGILLHNVLSTVSRFRKGYFPYWKAMETPLRYRDPLVSWGCRGCENWSPHAHVFLKDSLVWRVSKDQASWAKRRSSFILHWLWTTPHPLGRSSRDQDPPAPVLWNVSRKKKKEFCGQISLRNAAHLCPQFLIIVHHSG